MRGFSFFRHFLRDPLTVGSVWPSSRQLAQALTWGVDFERDFIVELGCGTGAVTKLIAENLSDPVNYLGFEIEPRMHDKLMLKFPNLRIVADSATELHRYLPQNRQAVSTVISSLPFTTLDPKITEQIVSIHIDSLKPGGIFRLFLYLHTSHLPRNQKFLAKLGEKLERLPDRIIYENIPPARVISFRKPEPAA